MGAAPRPTQSLNRYKWGCERCDRANPRPTIKLHLSTAPSPREDARNARHGLRAALVQRDRLAVIRVEHVWDGEGLNSNQAN